MNDKTVDVLKSILGASFDSANCYVEQYGFILRKVRINGQSLITTRDYRRDRINVDLLNNIVIKATVG